MLRLSRLTYSLAAALFCYGTVIFTVGPCLTSMAETFRVPLGQLGLIFTLYSLGLIPSALLNGYLSEVVGRRPILLVIVAIMGVGCVLFAAVPALGPRPSFALALGVMVVLGFGGGGIEALTNIVISEENQPAPAFALNATHAFFALGAVVGPLAVSALLRARLPWESAFYGAGALFAILFVALLPQRMPPGRGGPFPPGAVLRLLRSRLLWLLLAMIGLYVGAETGFAAWISPHMERVLGAPRGLAGLSVSTFWALMIVGRLAISPLAVRFRPPPLICALSLGSAIAAVAAASSRSAVGCLAATGMTGLFMSGIFALILVDASRQFQEHLGVVFGLIMVGVGIGALTIPAAMGWISDHAGLRTAMLVPSALMAVVTVSYVARWSQ